MTIKQGINKKLFSGESAKVFRGMLTLLMGAGLARIAGLVSIPILVRIYSPEDYGVLALYTSIVAILSPLLTLRYVQAIPLPKTDVMAFNLFSVCLKLIFVGSLIIGVILFLFGEFVFDLFNMSALLPWWWLVVVGAAGTSLYELFCLWVIRRKQYNVFAKNQVFQAIIGSVAKVGFGLAGFKSSGLLLGQVLSQGGAVAGFIKATMSDTKRLYPKITKKKEKIVVLFYQDFVWFRLPSQILMVLSVQAPILLMAMIYDREVTGQLSLAMMALSLPISLIGQAISKAYYAEIAGIGKSNFKKIQRITVDVQKRLFSVGLPIAIIAHFLAEWLFVRVFGDEWQTAGLFASLLAPCLLFQFTSSPLMEAINVLGKQSVFLVLHSLRIVGFVLIYMFARNLEESDFVFALSLYLSFFYFSTSVVIFYFLSISAKRGG